MGNTFICVKRMLREIASQELKVGMYVADLDRPWLETPFPLQGFYIRSPEDVARVSGVCERVFVDPRRYDARMGQQGAAQRRGWSTRVDEKGQIRKFRDRAPVDVRVTEYLDAASLEDELPAAREAFGASDQAFRTVWNGISERRKVPVMDLRRVVDPLVESVLRNKDALVALMRVQRTDQHTHEHCLALAVWGALMGRQLGLAPERIKRLALSCSLVDIGKVQLPRELLDKPGPLDEKEWELVRAHVSHSLVMLEEMGETDEEVLGVVRWHHERMDGSGYPDGLRGSAIPMFARIAGILDSYDAMISPRAASRTRSSFEALMELQDLSPDLYQPELVEQFSQAIGIFPNGCLVELSSGEVAVVFSQSTGRRLRPKVLLILDPQKRRRDDLVVVDLSADRDATLRISRELPLGAYGVDAREYFL
jgi:HD-GYP domain-containing protein (c-di-GMP phosphodiesterase class II)